MDRDITDLLQAAGRGDLEAQGELFARVERELKGLARRELVRWKPGSALHTTALVGEVFLRLFGRDGVPTPRSRRHFYAAAALVMHDVMIDLARANGRRPRNVPLPDDLASPAVDHADLVDLKLALEGLEGVDERSAEVFRLRIVLGLSFEEMTRTLGLSRSTVERDLRFARSWLRRRLSDSSAQGEERA